MSRGARRRRKRGREASDAPTGAARPARGWSPAMVAVLVCLVLVAQVAATAAAWVPAPHNGGDNTAYLALADALLEGRGYTEVWDPAAPPHTKYPPVFPLLLAGAIALGARTWTALKLVAAASTTAAVLLAFGWARRRGHGPLFAAAVAGLLAVSAAAVDASHWILSDPTFVALTLLALWALAGAPRPAGEGPEDSGAERGGAQDRGGRAPVRGVPGPGWLIVGCAAAILAYFTRSAGLPLLFAVAGWLALRRRWSALGGFAAAAGVPALLWWLRARAVPVAEGAYADEFWLRDPYTPELGRVDLLGLLGRAGENAIGYLGSHVPGAVVGQGGAWLGIVGVALVGFAMAGWAMSLRRRPGVAELFAPLYVGVILVWPPVWSGTRFALPLLPLLFVYAGEGLSAAAARLGRGAPLAAGAVAVALLGTPAVASWMQAVRGAAACAAAVESGGPWACWGPRFGEIVEAARWSATALPEGSVVLSRKPRIFYAVSGVASRAYPFTDDPDAFLAGARRAGARYVLLDFFGSQGPAFVGGAVRARPSAFCSIGAFERGQSAGPAAQLLGILPPEARAPVGSVEGVRVRIARCPAGMTREPIRTLPPAGDVVPLLARDGA